MASSRRRARHTDDDAATEAAVDDYPPRPLSEAADPDVASKHHDYVPGDDTDQVERSAADHADEEG